MEWRSEAILISAGCVVYCWYSIVAVLLYIFILSINTTQIIGSKVQSEHDFAHCSFLVVPKS